MLSFLPKKINAEEKLGKGATINIYTLLKLILGDLKLL
jgi:hypothetical protein